MHNTSVAHRERPPRLAPDQRDDRDDQAHDADDERGDQRRQHRGGRALGAAALGRAIVQEGKGEQPHHRRHRTAASP